MKILNSLLKTRKLATFGLATTAVFLAPTTNVLAATISLTFTELAGLTGGSPAATGVFYADLSGIGFDINSIQISDNSSGLGGSPGQFSGFDLDAIKISNVLATSAAEVNALPGLNVFNFSPSGTFLTPGTQRPPVDSALFGTTSGNVNNAVATLESFDANATTDFTAFGFVSLGDNGTISFNLTTPISTSSPLYLYIGEVGNNGEVAAGNITVSDQPITDVPEPTTIFSLSLLGIYFGFRRFNKTTKAT